MTRRAPSSRLCLGLVTAMRSEQVEAAQGEMLHRGGDEPLVASELNEAATAAALPRELWQDASRIFRCGRYGGPIIREHDSESPGTSFRTWEQVALTQVRRQGF